MNLDGKKTYLGIAVVLLAQLFKVGLGIDLNTDAGISDADLYTTLATLVGGALAIYGRYKAKLPLSPPPNTTPGAPS